MITSVLALAILVVLLFAVAGGFLLRLAGRVAVLAGLLAALLGVGVGGLLIAALGGLMVALGCSRPLDRRRQA